MGAASILRRLSSACVLAGAVGASVAPARAEDAPKARPAPVVRVYPVGVLLRGHPWFTPDRGPFPVDPDQVNDEASPLFGSEEEVVRPEGSLEALIDRLKAALATTEGDGVEDADFGGSSSRDLLFVAAPERVQQAIAKELAGLARDPSATWVVDVAWLEGDAAAGRGSGALAGAVASGALRPLGFARVLPTARGTGVVRDGGRAAFLQDYDTEIGCACNVPDPILGGAPQGLAVRAVAMPTAAGRWSVHLQGWWADEPTFSPRRMVGGFHFEDYPVGPRVLPPEGGDVFEMATVDGESFRVPLVLEEGAWELVPLSGRRVLAARLRVSRLEPQGGPAGALEAAPGERYGSGEPPGPLGPLESHGTSLGDLFAPVTSSRGRALRVGPSNYCPPEEPPLPSPRPGATADDVRWVLDRAVAPAPADAEGTSLRVQGARLLLRTDAARAAASETVVEALRANRERVTRVQATVVALPLAAFPEAWTDPDAAATAGLPALLARPGARRVATAWLDLRDGQRSAVVSGKETSYLRDYDVELACTTTIGNPIVGRLFEGTSLDVECVPVLSTSAVSLLVRFDRSALRGMRALSTRFGPIGAPSMLEQSLRGAVTLRPGETRLFGLSASGPEATLVLLHVER